MDADTDSHLWAESYERSASDVLMLQNEIARAIAEQNEHRFSWGNFSAFGLLLPTGTKMSQNEGGEIVRFVGLGWLALAGLGVLFRLLTGGAGANRKSASPTR